MSAVDRLLRDPGPPGIVYAATRKNVERWAEHLTSTGLRAAAYHGGLADAERTRVQDEFLAGRLDVIAATNAFGMGIDKRDSAFRPARRRAGQRRGLLPGGRAARGATGCRRAARRSFSPGRRAHAGVLPRRIEPVPGDLPARLAPDGRGWGRRGDRDGSGDAAASMAASTAARLLRRAAQTLEVEAGAGELADRFPGAGREGAARSRPPRHDPALRLRAAAGRGSSTTIRRRGRSAAPSRAAVRATFCLGWRRARGTAARRPRVRAGPAVALSAVARLPARFGVERIAQVLTGSRSREITERGLDRLPTFGRLAEKKIDDVSGSSDVLIEAGLLERRGIEGGRPGAFVLALQRGGRGRDARRAPAAAADAGGAPPGGGRQERQNRAHRSGREGLGWSRAPPGVKRGPDANLLLRLKTWRAG